MAYRRKYAKKLYKSGFTLVEILVSIAILSIAILPVLLALTTTLNMNRKLKKTEDATAAATNIMEEVKANGAKEYIAFDDAGNIKTDKYDMSKVEETDDTGAVTDTYYLYKTMQTVNGKDYNVETRFESMAKTVDTEDKTALENLDEITDYNSTKPVLIKGSGVTHDVTLDTVPMDEMAARTIAAEINVSDGKTWEDVYNANLTGDGENKEFMKDVVITIDKQEVQLQGKTVDRVIAYAQVLYQFVNYGERDSGTTVYKYATTKRCIYRGAGNDTDLQTVYILNKAIPSKKTENVNKMADNVSVINRTDIPVNIIVWQQRAENAAERGKEYNYIAGITYDTKVTDTHVAKISVTSGKYYGLVGHDDVTAIYDSFSPGITRRNWNISTGGYGSTRYVDSSWFNDFFTFGGYIKSSKYDTNEVGNRVFKNVSATNYYPVFLLGYFYVVGAGSVPASGTMGDPFGTSEAEGVERVYRVTITVYERNEDGSNGAELFTNLTSAIE